MAADKFGGVEMEEEEEEEEEEKLAIWRPTLLSEGAVGKNLFHQYCLLRLGYPHAKFQIFKFNFSSSD